MTDQPKVKCGTCRHFKPFYPELRANYESREGGEDGILGDCTAIKTDKLPYAWRYATREKSDAWSLTPIYCAAHEPIPTPTDSQKEQESLNLEQFSPGPWRAEGRDKTVVNDARGYTLVLCPGHTLARAQANARLIARALPLLTTLHNLTVWAGRTSAGRGSWQYINATVELCRVTGQKYQDTHYPPTTDSEGAKNHD